MKTSDKDVEAAQPCIPIEVGTNEFRQGLHQLITECGEEGGLDSELGVVGLESGDEDLVGLGVVSCVDDHREAAQHSLGHCEELRRVDVVTAELGEHSTRVWKVLEQILVKLLSKLEAMLPLSEGMAPLTPDLDLLKGCALLMILRLVIGQHTYSQTYNHSDTQRELHPLR